MFCRWRRAERKRGGILRFAQNDSVNLAAAFGIETGSRHAATVQDSLRSVAGLKPGFYIWICPYFAVGCNVSFWILQFSNSATYRVFSEGQAIS